MNLVPERSLADPGCRVERSSIAGSPAPGGGKSSPGLRSQAGGADPVPQPPGLKLVFSRPEPETTPGQPGV